jgi:hypothetical protein
MDQAVCDELPEPRETDLTPPASPHASIHRRSTYVPPPARNPPASPSRNPSLVPNARDRRSAVSAVMPRLPSTISLIRRGGTLIARQRVLAYTHGNQELFQQDFTGVNVIQFGHDALLVSGNRQSRLRCNRRLSI